MKNNLKDRLLIFIRHGERSDRVADFIPTFHKFDPELTENGKRQASEIGSILSGYLLEKYPSFNKIKIISSPFARTIQTSKNILKNLSSKHSIENNLYLNYYFSEYIKADFPSFDVSSFLVVKNQIPKLLLDLEDTNLIFSNEPKNIILDNFENDEICKLRVLNGINDLLSNLKNEEENVFIIVSHGDPINFINLEYGYPGPFGWRNIKYCNLFVYEVQIDELDNINNLKYIESFFPKQE